MDVVRNLPKASRKYEFFCAFVNVLELLKIRGYNVDKYSDYVAEDTSLKERYENYIGDEDRPFTPYQETFESDKGDIILCILDAVEDSSYLKNQFLDRWGDPKRKDAVHILAVFSEPRDEPTIDPGNSTLEILCYQQLLVNPSRHSRAPVSVRKLTRRRKKELLESNPLKNRRLTTIYATDPMALFLNARVGDVLKYEDAKVYTEQGLTTVEYKMISESPLI